MRVNSLRFCSNNTAYQSTKGAAQVPAVGFVRIASPKLAPASADREKLEFRFSGESRRFNPKTPLSDFAWVCKCRSCKLNALLVRGRTSKQGWQVRVLPTLLYENTRLKRV